MIRRVIGLSGRAGAGKTAAANHLVRAHGFVRVRFADTLKQMLKTFGLTDAEIDGDLKEQPCYKLGGKTPRWAMQTLGTEWGRELIFQNIWVEAWHRLLPPARDIVADDVRFENEARMIRGLGGRVMEIRRDGSLLAADHASEAGVVADTVMVNGGSIDDLFTKLDRLALLWDHAEMMGE